MKWKPVPTNIWKKKSTMSTEQQKKTFGGRKPNFGGKPKFGTTMIIKTGKLNQEWEK